jgi:hypothetical protein
MEKSFIDLQKDLMEVMGFWTEEYKSVILSSIEGNFKTEVIREFGISDLVVNGDKFLIKWYKRHRPLTNEELKEKYGR